MICLKNCETNNFSAILEFCAYEIEFIKYENEKFTGINFRCQTNVKCFIQTQLLSFCKDTAKVSSLPLLKITTKSTHFLPATKKIPILWNERQRNKTLHLNTEWENICKLQRIFWKIWIKIEHFKFFQVIFFFTVVFCLFICTSQCTKNDLFR